MKSSLKLLLVSALGLAAVAANAETYAFMVGINDYPDVVDKDGKPIKDKDGNVVDSDLNGCVNDVKNYNDLLVNRYGVKSANIKTALDKGANAEGFLAGMKWLIQSAKPGDSVVFVYSGHGTQFDDPETKETDGKQEAIVLADERLVTGDFFREMSQDMSKAGINATFVFDSCYSGGMTRETASYDGAPATARKRFLPAEMIPTAQWLPKADTDGLKASVRQVPVTSGGSYVFLLGGREDQTTTDLQFKDATKPSRGLFSLVIGLFLDKLPDTPIEEVMEGTASLLKEKGFDQVPQIEMSSPDRGKQPLVIKS